ncbi:MAG TPA: holo-ACP synthase [Polyangia bacterium]
MIVGVGIDLAPIGRMAEAMARHEGRLEARLFTDGERAFCRARAEPMQHFAARFAAKEATLKALRVPAGLSWHELEVMTDDHGAPRLELHGVAARAAESAGVRKLHLSLTHAGDQAIAFVVAEG